MTTPKKTTKTTTTKETVQKNVDDFNDKKKAELDALYKENGQYYPVRQD